ncbi:hypothetical protein M8J76_006673 [Diaphorina citri]|nr:hypothetical protein M8J75_013404 [Diaphorina citri]KAI5736747.1 hypothetical protein M8J76_006673 [Diaphorina citri]
MVIRCQTLRPPLGLRSAASSGPSGRDPATTLSNSNNPRPPQVGLGVACTSAGASSGLGSPLRERTRIFPIGSGQVHHWERISPPIGSGLGVPQGAAKPPIGSGKVPHLKRIRSPPLGADYSDARCNNIVPKQQLQNCSEMMGTSDPCSMQHEVQVKMSQVVTQGESICLRDFF